MIEPYPHFKSLVSHQGWVQFLKAMEQRDQQQYDKLKRDRDVSADEIRWRAVERDEIVNYVNRYIETYDHNIEVEKAEAARQKGDGQNE